MELSSSYIQYLQNRTDPTIQRNLCSTLYDNSYYLEAYLLRWYHAHGKGKVTALPSADIVPWSDHVLWVGDTLPPEAEAGDIWLDTCEVMPMLLVPRNPNDLEGVPPDIIQEMTTYHSWVAVRPVAQWQFRAFMELSTRVPQVVQIAPTFQLFSEDRILKHDEQSIVTHMTRDEALMYSIWFWKGLPSLESWRCALSVLSDSETKALWKGSGREWVMDRSDYNEGVRIIATPESVALSLEQEDDDLDEEDEIATGSKIVVGEWKFLPDVGFRTAVHMQLGLTRVSDEGFIVDNVRLLNNVHRTYLSM